MKTYTRSQSRTRQTRTDNKRPEAPRGDNNRPNHGRVNPREMHQKYLTMAREAAASGDVVEAENYYQHAEHFYRIVSERAAIAAERAVISSVTN